MNIQPRLQTITCPCCGGFMGEAAPLDAVRPKVRAGHARIVFELLAKSVGENVPSDLVLSAMYSGRSKDGHANGRNTMRVTISRLRRKLERYGWSIHAEGWRQGVNGSYKLAPVEAGA